MLFLSFLACLGRISVVGVRGEYMLMYRIDWDDNNDLLHTHEASQGHPHRVSRGQD